MRKLQSGNGMREERGGDMASMGTGFGNILTAADHDQEYLRKVRDGMEEQIRILR